MSSGSERPTSGTQNTPSRLRADELGGDLERESRLASAAGPGERQQARAVGEHGDELRELALPADERARGEGQVGRVERAERREVAVAELVQALGVDEILEPVLSEVANRGVALEKSPSRLGEDDLTSVRGGRDTGGAVHVHADVALVRPQGLAGVDPHADADRAGRERISRRRPPPRRHPSLVRTRRRTRRPACRPRAPVSRECVPQGAAVLGEEIGVVRPVLLEEPRRALDVREEKGDGAGGKLRTAMHARRE